MTIASDLRLFQSYQSKQNNPDRVPIMLELLEIKCFNRINPNRTIPTRKNSLKTTVPILFQSYQSKQINPDVNLAIRFLCILALFQSYQSKQINPDDSRLKNEYTNTLWFQSYQSKQINPDPDFRSVLLKKYVSFNRINPNRSIPTSW